MLDNSDLGAKGLALGHIVFLSVPSRREMVPVGCGAS